MKQGSCDLTLDYNKLIEVSSTEQEIALPVLNDIPLYLSVPKIKHHSVQAILISSIWLFTLAAFLFFLITLLGRADVCRKPDR
jgi:hypothetical protein